jgi:hypothetical protein
MLTIAPFAQRQAVRRYIAELPKEAAADRAAMTEVEEMLLRGLNTEGLI